MILGPDGKPLVVYERPSLGFVTKMLPLESGDPPTGISAAGRTPEWLDSETHHQAEGR